MVKPSVLGRFASLASSKELAKIASLDYSSKLN